MHGTHAKPVHGSCETPSRVEMRSCGPESLTTPLVGFGQPEVEPRFRPFHPALHGVDLARELQHLRRAKTDPFPHRDSKLDGTLPSTLDDQADGRHHRAGILQHGPFCYSYAVAQGPRAVLNRWFSSEDARVSIVPMQAAHLERARHHVTDGTKVYLDPPSRQNSSGDRS